MDSQLAIDAFWHCAPITFNFCPDEYLSDTKSVKMSSDDRSITALLTRNPSPHSQVFPVADLHTACEILVSRCRQIVEVNFVSDEMTKTRNLSGIFQKDDISVVNLMATNVKSCRNCSEKKEEEEKKEDADLIEINFNESSGGTTLQVNSDFRKLNFSSGSLHQNRYA